MGIEDILKGSAGAGLLAIVLFLLKWMRGKNEDAATVNFKEAEAELKRADAKEATARSKKIEIDGAAVNLENALRMLQIATDQTTKVREDLQGTQDELTDIRKQLKLALDSCEKCSKKLEMVQEQLNEERQANVELTKKYDDLYDDYIKLQK